MIGGQPREADDPLDSNLSSGTWQLVATGVSYLFGGLTITIWKVMGKGEDQKRWSLRYLPTLMLLLLSMIST